MISVVIPCLNDQSNLNLTLNSLFKSTQVEVECIVYDDASRTPLVIPPEHAGRVKLIRNPVRMGPAFARSLGAQIARFEYFFTVDSHTKFAAGWDTALVERLSGNVNKVVVFPMHILRSWGDPDSTTWVYNGARLYVKSPLGNREGTFETIALRKAPPILTAVKLASYGFHRSYFNSFRGYSDLRMYGQEELCLTLKVNLSGGSFELVPGILLSHVNTATIFMRDPVLMFYNRIRLAQSVMDASMYSYFMSLLPKDHEDVERAFQKATSDREEIAEFTEFYRKAFPHDFNWLVKELNIDTTPFDENFKPNVVYFDAPVTISPGRKQWNGVKHAWEKADAFIKAMASRGAIAAAKDILSIDGVSGERVSAAVYQERVVSCFGGNGAPPCVHVRISTDKGSFCDACGCGGARLARLDGEGYTKLHYPELQCPLKRKGFSNYEVPLSIVMPVLNDNEEANLTIASIRQTAPPDVEIIVVDDASDAPVKLDDPNAKLFRFAERRGIGQARHFGAEQATSKLLLFIDAHMRFDKTWFDNAISRVSKTPKTLWCGVCLGLNATVTDIEKPKGVYSGADLHLYRAKGNEVFAGVWRRDTKGEDDYEIGCVMGACYFIHRDWFMHLRGWHQMRSWGGSEPIISTKVWLAGGEVRLMKSVRIGHKFRSSAPYSTNISSIIYNKLAYMYMMFPGDLYERLAAKIPDDANKVAALELVQRNKPQLDEERAYYKSIFTHDIYWLCEKFKIEIPT
jgi:glycosyltransferase involved in cell wall biosynthesis